MTRQNEFDKVFYFHSRKDSKSQDYRVVKLVQLRKMSCILSLKAVSEAVPWYSSSRYYDQFVNSGVDRHLKREDRSAKMPFFYQMYLKDRN